MFLANRFHVTHEQVQKLNINVFPRIRVRDTVCSAKRRLFPELAADGDVSPHGLDKEPYCFHTPETRVTDEDFPTLLDVFEESHGFSPCEPNASDEDSPTRVHVIEDTHGHHTPPRLVAVDPQAPYCTTPTAHSNVSTPVAFTPPGAPPPLHRPAGLLYLSPSSTVTIKIMVEYLHKGTYTGSVTVCGDNSMAFGSFLMQNCIEENHICCKF